MEAIPTVYSGYLVKRGKLVKSWLRRYFSLECGVLTYSEDKGKKAKGQINIANATIESAPDEKFKRARCFIVTAASGEILYMQADSEGDKNEWIRILSHVAKAAVFMQGLLSLQTGWRKRWKERYFVLSGPRLAWYESEANATAPGGAKPIASVFFSGPETKGKKVRITRNPPASYCNGVEANVFERLILIETGLDDAALALPWPPVVVAAPSVTEGEGAGDDAEASAASASADATTAEDATTTSAGGEPENTNKKTSSSLLLKRFSASSSNNNNNTIANKDNLVLALAASVEEAQAWCRAFESATKDAVAGDSAPTKEEEEEEEEEEEAAAEENGQGDDKSNSGGAGSTKASASSTAPAPAPLEVQHQQQPTVEEKPLETYQEKQQRLLSELQIQAKALVKAETKHTEDKQQHFDTNSARSENHEKQQEQQPEAEEVEIDISSLVVPVGGKIVLVNGKPTVKTPKPTTSAVITTTDLSTPPIPATLETSSSMPATTTTSSQARVGASGETSYESTIKVKEAKAKFGTTNTAGNSSGNVYNSARRGSKDSVLDTASVIRDEIQEQRIRQGERQCYEAGGHGRRGDRRFDDEDDDEGSVTAGYVRETAGHISGRRAAELTPVGTGRRWKGPGTGGGKDTEGQQQQLQQQQQAEAEAAAAAIAAEAEVQAAEREDEMKKERERQEEELLARKHQEKLQKQAEEEELARKLEEEEKELERLRQAAEAAEAARLKHLQHLKEEQEKAAARRQKVIEEQQKARKQAEREANALAAREAEQAERARVAAAAAKAQREKEAAEAAAAESARKHEAEVQEQKEEEIRRQKQQQEEEEEAVAAAAAEAEALAANASPSAAAGNGNIPDDLSIAASSVVGPAPGAWTAPPEAQERQLLRRRVFEYLLRRSTAASDPTQAEYLENSLVPEVEEALYVAAVGDRDAYLDGGTLKSRLKSIFTERTAASKAAAAAVAEAEEAQKALANHQRSTRASNGANTPSTSENSTSKNLRVTAQGSVVKQPNEPNTTTEPSILFSPDAGNTTTTTVVTSPKAGGAAAAATTASSAAPLASPGNNNAAVATPGQVRRARHLMHSSSANGAAATTAATAETTPPLSPIPVMAMSANTTPLNSMNKSGKQNNDAVSTTGSTTTTQQQQGGKGGEEEADETNASASAIKSRAARSNASKGTTTTTTTTGSSYQMVSPRTNEPIPQPSKPKEPRWGGLNGATVPYPGNLPTRHYPAMEPGGVHIKLVLERREEQFPPLPALNKWQHRSCAECGATQTTGMFGLKANYCWYTELLYCPTCMGGEDGMGVLRPLPWRIVQELDDTPYLVSASTANYIDSVWEMPIIALTAVAPKTLSKSPNLRKISAIRGIIADLREKIIQVVATSAITNVDDSEADKSNSNSNAVRLAILNTSTTSSVLSGPRRGSGLILSEELPPVTVLAASSPAAAAALAACTTTLRNALGSSLAFMGEAPELLPLSLIVPAASPAGATRILPRLEEAQRRLSELLEQVEMDAGIGGGDESFEGNGEEEEEEEEEEGNDGGARGQRSQQQQQQQQRGGGGRGGANNRNPSTPTASSSTPITPSRRFAGNTPATATAAAAAAVSGSASKVSKSRR